MRTMPNAHIWLVAEQFFNAAEHIWNDNDIKVDHYTYPLIVNYAFSCELSLKALESKVKFQDFKPDVFPEAIKTESAIRIRGHDLNEIFNKLRPEIRSAIQTSFLSLTGNSLSSLLEECAKYFELGRYSYEQINGSYSLSNIRKLAKGLLDAAKIYGESQG